MTIPECRDELMAIASSLLGRGDRDSYERILTVVRAMRRRPATRRAPVYARPVTPDLTMRIQSAAAADPTLSQMELARRFGVNIGRVSEALNACYDWT